MNHCGRLSIAGLCVLFLTACATSQTGAPPVDDRSVGGAETRGTGDRAGPSGGALGGRNLADLLATRRVYFAFDSSSIDDEARAVIEAHAQHLVANPTLKLRLEGHCDERGTREYNLALGERRAQAVARMFRILGVTQDRISSVSYGEEKPLNPGHNESAWRENRRVEIMY